MLGEIQRLDPDIQALRLRWLDDYQCSFKNRRFDDMIKEGEFIVPSASPKPIGTINLDDLGDIFEAPRRSRAGTARCDG
jgi:hypothetical protein